MVICCSPVSPLLRFHSTITLNKIEYSKTIESKLRAVQPTFRFQRIKKKPICSANSSLLHCQQERSIFSDSDFDDFLTCNQKTITIPLIDHFPLVFLFYFRYRFLVLVWSHTRMLPTHLRSSKKKHSKRSHHHHHRDGSEAPGSDSADSEDDSAGSNSSDSAAAADRDHKRRHKRDSRKDKVGHGTSNSVRLPSSR